MENPDQRTGPWGAAPNPARERGSQDPIFIFLVLGRRAKTKKMGRGSGGLVPRRAWAAPTVLIGLDPVLILWFGSNLGVAFAAVRGILRNVEIRSGGVRLSPAGIVSAGQ
jgi:hypothetical protein